MPFLPPNQQRQSTEGIPIQIQYSKNSKEQNCVTGQKGSKSTYNCRVKDIIGTDLKDIGLSWDEASELAHPGSSWRQRVAQCVFDTG